MRTPNPRALLRENRRLREQLADLKAEVEPLFYAKGAAP